MRIGIFWSLGGYQEIMVIIQVSDNQWLNQEDVSGNDDKEIILGEFVGLIGWMLGRGQEEKEINVGIF